ncbi:MAG TPA: GtrA family protein [Candidatus Eisenbergiella merdipullorum]|uniref:GtrA family protein n=1 Tax=Candidatus Eisenbergiella merdipullorum TaxID=2838553 RepID=A0A9D2I7H5_9FIRM|nr:GtrA family protein [Candidatus Eisenbergiella merdipullorum]
MAERKLLDIKEILKFGSVGILNTIIGTAVMFFAYNILHCGYWVSSALNYIVGSIFSFWANKHFTFKSSQKSVGEIVRFIINITICYMLAYGIAEPLVRKLGENLKLNLPRNILEQIAMLFGMCFFVVFNFFGQKLFVFKKQ